MALTPPLFEDQEDRVLTADELSFVQAGYERAIDALRRNITEKGFTACSLNDNEVYGTDENYRAVWARDGAKTICWTLDLDDEDIVACQDATLRTLLAKQSDSGQIPGNVTIDHDEAEFGGVGNIASIDSGLWVIIAVWAFCSTRKDFTLAKDFEEELSKAMEWLNAHDSNNDGLLEIPEAGDWTDLFARSYHVLYDEVLWFRALECFAALQRELGHPQAAERFDNMASRARRAILRNFWPSTGAKSQEDGLPSFAEMQFGLGDARYLVAEVSPFQFSWRCDVYANLLAFLVNLVDRQRAMMTFRFMWGSGVNEPGPVANLYPVVQSGDREWRDYFTVNLLNLPYHYHNGGVWPFVGGLWVRYIHKLGIRDLARREMLKLAQLCHQGIHREWEFNEWHHGKTGRPMGKAFQAWSAASYIKTCHSLHVEPDSIELN
ncbi:amylo-alpha-1,6-glucosidase [Stratiformator vulcanicus]|uniref:beta-fructofuranosidase n=1 Tax=Stratiformator vulcanicus TaxID=2527980 RepID=A0A517R3Y9_9PLAN|nr:glycoside hydrolase 100 family protein [Stratiformator vulcanicus]QDT38591.1 Plant neutral invertase [Stratiformator vulcanicus]